MSQYLIKNMGNDIPKADNQGISTSYLKIPHQALKGMQGADMHRLHKEKEGEYKNEYRLKEAKIKVQQSVWQWSIDQVRLLSSQFLDSKFITLKIVISGVSLQQGQKVMILRQTNLISNFLVYKPHMGQIKIKISDNTKYQYVISPLGQQKKVNVQYFSDKIAIFGRLTIIQNKNRYLVLKCKYFNNRTLQSFLLDSCITPLILLRNKQFFQKQYKGNSTFFLKKTTTDQSTIQQDHMIKMLKFSNRFLLTAQPYNFRLIQLVKLLVDQLTKMNQKEQRNEQQKKQDQEYQKVQQWLYFQFQRDFKWFQNNQLYFLKDNYFIKKLLSLSKNTMVKYLCAMSLNKGRLFYSRQLIRFTFRIHYYLQFSNQMKYQKVQKNNKVYLLLVTLAQQFGKFKQTVIKSITLASQKLEEKMAKRFIATYIGGYFSKLNSVLFIPVVLKLLQKKNLQSISTVLINHFIYCNQDFQLFQRFLGDKTLQVSNQIMQISNLSEIRVKYQFAQQVLLVNLETILKGIYQLPNFYQLLDKYIYLKIKCLQKLRIQVFQIQKSHQILRLKTKQLVKCQKEQNKVKLYTFKLLPNDLLSITVDNRFRFQSLGSEFMIYFDKILIQYLLRNDQNKNYITAEFTVQFKCKENQIFCKEFKYLFESFQKPQKLYQKLRQQKDIYNAWMKAIKQAYLPFEYKFYLLCALATVSSKPLLFVFKYYFDLFELCPEIDVNSILKQHLFNPTFKYLFSSMQDLPQIKFYQQLQIYSSSLIKQYSQSQQQLINDSIEQQCHYIDKKQEVKKKVINFSPTGISRLKLNDFCSFQRQSNKKQFLNANSIIKRDNKIKQCNLKQNQLQLMDHGLLLNKQKQKQQVLCKEWVKYICQQ